MALINCRKIPYSKEQRESDSVLVELQTKLKRILTKNYQRLSDRNPDNPILTTDLTLVSLHFDEGHHQHEFELQHEFRQLEDERWSPFPKAKPQIYSTSNLFGCGTKYRHFRTMLTRGVSGAGKSTLVNKLILDWVDNKSNQDVDLMFPFSFWELNLLKKRKLSLLELLYKFFPELENPGITDLENRKVWFILDGFNDCRLSLDFRKTKKVTDVLEVSSLSCLLTNLIQKDALLPTAHVWITSRPSTISLIPAECLGGVTELKGFSDAQMDEFFGRAIRNKELAGKVVARVNAAKRLHVLCQVPLVATVCAWVFNNHLPTLHECDCSLDFLVAGLPRIYAGLFQSSDAKAHRAIANLEKLAAKQLQDGTAVVYVDHLKEHAVTFEDAVDFAELNPLIFREEVGVDGSAVFHFSHPSVMEYMAAVGIMRAFLDVPAGKSHVLKSHVLKKMVDKAQACDQGQLDGVLRFVVGISRDGVSELHKDKISDYNVMISEHFKEKLLQFPTNDSIVNLLYCLNETDYERLHRQVMRFLGARMTPTHSKYTVVEWSFLAYQVLSVAGGSELFELDVSSGSDVAVIGYLPAITAATKVSLRFCNLTDECCKPLATILSSDTSYLRELDLGYNGITVAGLFHISRGLQHPNCRLERLRLAGCKVTQGEWAVLNPALLMCRHLCAIDLSGNDVGEAGLKALSGVKQAQNSPLRFLKVSYCKIDRKACLMLARVLDTYFLQLTELDVSINGIEDPGLETLLRSINHRTIKKLELYHCKLTQQSCKMIGDCMYHLTALRELNLSSNPLKDAGVANLCKSLRKTKRCIEILNLSNCGVTEQGCAELSVTLKEHPKCLRHLDLSRNKLDDAGVNNMAPALTDPQCCLEVLRLTECELTEKCCATLSSALSRAPSALRELDLCENRLTDQGLKLLCGGLSLPVCRLEILLLRSCGLTTVSFTYLRETLKANPAHLRELHLMGNQFRDVAVPILTCFKKYPGSKMSALDIEAELEDTRVETTPPPCCDHARKRTS